MHIMRVLHTLLLVLFPVSASASAISDLLFQRNTALTDCMSHLPARESIAWRDSKGLGKFPSACLAAKRLRDDARDMQRYRDDLMKMFDAAPQKPALRDIAETEAEDIAVRLVTATRETGREFKMINSAILNNVLVNIGKKKGGQCYQWVRVFVAALPPQPYKTFERHWGGAYVNRFLENNSVIFTVRGLPLDTGILYDAWRAHGNPWWRPVEKDHYPWKERFTEVQILAGKAQVTGIAEVKNTPKAP